MKANDKTITTNDTVNMLVPDLLPDFSVLPVYEPDQSVEQPYDQPAPSSEKADAFGSTTATSATAATFDNNIDGLLIGTHWASTSVTYSFTDTFEFRWVVWPFTFDYTDYEAGYPDAATHDASFQMYTAAMRTAARDFIGTGGEFYNVSLLSPSDLTGANDRDATIRMAMSSDPGTAYGYYPAATVQAGDIWVSTSGTYNNPVIGTYAYHTIGHELGHALGLKHGHETGGVRNVAMNSSRDSMEFSIMTYRSYEGDPLIGGYSNEFGGYAQTLMMYDIAAIQHMYGAWFGYNSGDTTYTFSKTTGEMFINGVGQGTPYSNDIFRTIWDGNGIDTYDFSNYTTNLSIDLSPGGWSDLDVGGNFQRAYLGDGHYARGQVFNALQYNGDARSLIENAKGGTGADSMFGNAANNTLWAGDGNDTLKGAGGSDVLDGGSGSDVLYGGDGDDTIWGASSTVVADGGDTLYGESGNDIIGGSYGNDVIDGGSGNDSLYGDEHNDTLRGGDGNDYLNGGWGWGADAAGADTLDGGNGIDTLVGGQGNDTYIVDTTTDIITENAGEGTDTVKSSVTFTLGNNVEKLTLTGAAAINGTGNGLKNTLTGNNANNTLIGNAGNDTLNGNAGIDTLLGGPGNDIYVVDTTTDIITENAREGTDTVKSSVTYTLGGNLEKLTLTGAAAINGTGNSLNNTLTGNSASNSLTGLAGNDTLNGGGGNDKYIWTATAFNSGDIRASTLDKVSGFNAGDSLDFTSAIETLLKVNGKSLSSAAANIVLPNAFSANTNVAWTGTDLVIDLNADHSITATDFHVQLIGFGGSLVYDAAADVFHA